jgi:UrcA family protein
MTMNTTNTTARKPLDVRCLVIAISAMTCLALSSTVVHAADQSTDSEPMKKTVNYGDLNLAHPQGVEHLYQRIVRAARQVCEPLDSRPLQAKAESWSCTKLSIERAVAAVDLPALTAMYGIKTGQPNRTAKLAKQ